MNLNSACVVFRPIGDNRDVPSGIIMVKERGEKQKRFLQAGKTEGLVWLVVIKRNDKAGKVGIQGKGC